jgi:tRNA uridine 5-carboxymethylaminomethyl modification enzyme
MSCNPAIGGWARARSSARSTPSAGSWAWPPTAGGIQFRMLNRSKGPAVWAPRAQADRDLYAEAVQDLLATVRTGSHRRAWSIGWWSPAGGCAHLVAATLRVTGRDAAGRPRAAASGSVVLTTAPSCAVCCTAGAKTQGGRVGESAAVTQRRTPAAGPHARAAQDGHAPRRHRDSIDYAKCLAQAGGDDPPSRFRS